MRLQQFDLVRSSGDFPKFQSFSNQIQETQQREFVLKTLLSSNIPF